MAPQHPNSDRNLRPRQPDYPGEDKRRRELSVTDAGWDGARAAASAIGVHSLSALIEQIGRGEVVLSSPDQWTPDRLTNQFTPCKSTKVAERFPMNAKEELIEFLSEIDKKPICANMCRGWSHSQGKELFLLRAGYSEGDWQNFLGALDFEYDNGYGEQELHGTLWLDGSWAERAEYDGSEWWELRQHPEIPMHLSA